MSAAAALDAADGVMDGRHFGRPIVQAGAQPAFFGAQPTVFGAQPAFFGGQAFAPTTVLGGYPSMGGQVFGGASSAALALDAADGVIDGKSFGRPIIQAGAQPAFFGGQQFVQAQPTFVQAQPAFGAQTFGFPQAFGQPTVFGGASSAALALDAADGVIDGKSFGRPIIQAGAQPAFFGGQQFVQAQPAFGFPQAFGQPTVFGGASSAALALDAADGVIDGKSFGRPIIQAGAQPAFFGGQQFVQAQPTFVQAQPAFGFPQAFGQPTVFGGANSAALALDAADGVIDGKSFGRPIVQAGGLVPYTGVAAPQYGGFQGVPTFAAAPQAFGGAVPAQFYGGYPGAAQYGGVPVAGYGGAYPQYGNTYAQAPRGRFGRPSANQRAAQLDAADGVIDGRYYGRPIQQRRR